MAPPHKRHKGINGRSRDRRFQSTRVNHSPEEHAENFEQDEIDSEVASDDRSSVASDENLVSFQRPYNVLLQSLQASTPKDEPKRKRRKISTNGKSDAEPHIAEDPGNQYLEDDQEDETNDADQASEGGPAEDLVYDDEEDASDPFESHFACPEESHLAAKIKAASQGLWTSEKGSLGSLGKCTRSVPSTGNQTTSSRTITSTDQLKLKRKLIEPAQKHFKNLNRLEQAILPQIFDYSDILFGSRTTQNSESLRKMTCLHALNHVFKTRDRVLKNNAKLSRNPEMEDLDLRDQGFTRPKVLYLLETRQACVRAAETMMDLCEPEQQENKKRFLESFSEPEGKFSEEKPADFKELFDGNDDNEFRIGVKFTRKTVKYFSKFYGSDVIFASPLGLRRAIESGGPKKKKDADFLSSIELVVVDQADAMLMQNWEHVEYVFSHLNLQPKDAHGCDFSRVRSWYLDGHSRFLRQTVVLSSFITPELNSLFSSQMHNVSGKLKYQPSYEGSITDINLSIKQTFQRFNSPTPSGDPDARFTHFTRSIIPSLTRLPSRPADDGSGGAGVLMFIPTYHDFVRVRNYFASSSQTEHISFGAVSEYTEAAEVRRARSHFLSGRHSVLLYTGRAHHFRRYIIRGAKRVVFYQLPDNPVFYEEVVKEMLGTSIAEGRIDTKDVSVRALFSKWDGLRLERVVGSSRVGGMLREKSGDVFDFV